MFTWKIAIIKVAKTKTDLNKFTKKRWGLVKIIAETEVVMASIIIKIKESISSIDKD
jgi:hypothetical protein